ncbi:MAG: type II toxin-antitoxin system Phd/YefM family antitoxin [Mangrovibacterium sp.]
MIVISSAELRSNLKKYLDLAKTEHVIIQRGKTETFHLTAERVLEPDHDFQRAISMEEFSAGAKAHIRKLYSQGKK